jgi:SNF2 family DNA or RNA helicase
MSIMPIEFKAKLHSYQETIVKWSSGIDSGIIALDMGLGKSVVATAIICAKSYHRTLIVMPLSILDQWHSTLTRMTNLAPSEILKYHGASRHNADMSKYRIILTTYDLVRRDLDNKTSCLYKAHRAHLFDCMILDEAHRIRNKSTQSYKSCKSISEHMGSKWLLSGTIITNEFDDLLTAIDFLNVGTVTSATGSGHKGVDDASLKNWKTKYYYYLTKKEAICAGFIHLPEKKIHEHVLKFDPIHGKIYGECFREVREIYRVFLRERTQYNYGCVLEKILRLKQCCNHPDAMLNRSDYSAKSNKTSDTMATKSVKDIPAFVDHIKHLEYDLLDVFEKTTKSTVPIELVRLIGEYTGDGPTISISEKFTKIAELVFLSKVDDNFIIFSQWSHSLDILSLYLSKIGVSWLKYNGSMNLSSKNNVLKSFRDNSVKVLLMTITSGGVGLDLSYINNMVILDSWWNSALEEQAMDRIYRIGQSKSVTIHRLYMVDSIEMWMKELKNEKKMVDVKYHENDEIYHTNKSLLTTLLRRFTQIPP